MFRFEWKKEWNRFWIFLEIHYLFSEKINLKTFGVKILIKVLMKKFKPFWSEKKSSNTKIFNDQLKMTKNKRIFPQSELTQERIIFQTFDFMNISKSKIFFLCSSDDSESWFSFEDCKNDEFFLKTVNLSPFPLIIELLCSILIFTRRT